MTLPDSGAAPGFAWQTCLDVDGQDAGHYLDYFNAPLLGLEQFLVKARVAA